MSARNSRSYPLPAFTGGGGVTVPVERGSQAILFDLLRGAAPRPTGRHAAPDHRGHAGADDATRIAFHLVPDPDTGGYLVRHEGSTLGRVPRSLRASYPELDGLLAQGYEPEVTAEIGLAEGTGRMGGRLHLPAPALAVPANRPPSEPWAFLPGGTVRVIDVSAGDGRPTDTAGQWLATVDLIGGIAVAAVDGRVLGPLGEADSAAIRELVAHYLALGLVPVARVFCLREEGRVRTVLDALATAEAPEEALEPVVSPLPDITPSHPDTGQFPVVPATADAWAVTMAEHEVTEEFPAVTVGPRHRVVGPAAVDAADDDGAAVPARASESTPAVPRDPVPEPSSTPSPGAPGHHVGSPVRRRPTRTAGSGAHRAGVARTPAASSGERRRRLLPAWPFLLIALLCAVAAVIILFSWGGLAVPVILLVLSALLVLEGLGLWHRARGGSGGRHR